jgi:hypothetical protein
MRLLLVIHLLSAFLVVNLVAFPFFVAPRIAAALAHQQTELPALSRLAIQGSLAFWVAGAACVPMLVGTLFPKITLRTRIRLAMVSVLLGILGTIVLLIGAYLPLISVYRNVAV